MIDLAPSAHGGGFASSTTGLRAEIEFLRQQLQALVPALLEVVRVNTELARGYRARLRKSACQKRSASAARKGRAQPRGGARSGNNPAPQRARRILRDVVGARARVKHAEK